MSALASRLIQAAWMIPTALFLGWWAWQCVQVWVQRARAMRARAMRAHELAPPRPLPIRGGRR